MAKTRIPENAPESTPPPPAVEPPQVDPRDQRLAELEARLASQEQAWAERMERIAMGTNREAPAPQVEALPTEAEIADAVESGDGKKAARLMARLQAGLVKQTEDRVTKQLGGAVDAVRSRLEKLTALNAPSQLKHYPRFKAEIESEIRKNGIDATDPDALRIVHDLVAARHMDELIAEATQAAVRQAEGDTETRLLGAGRRRVKRGEEYIPQASISPELRTLLEEQGFEDENDFALSRGHKDPTGEGRHWDYMQHKGRKTERAAMPGGDGTSAWAASLREEAKARRTRAA